MKNYIIKVSTDYSTSYRGFSFNDDYNWWEMDEFFNAAADQFAEQLEGSFIAEEDYEFEDDYEIALDEYYNGVDWEVHSTWESEKAPNLEDLPVFIPEKNWLMVGC